MYLELIGADIAGNTRNESVSTETQQALTDFYSSPYGVALSYFATNGVTVSPEEAGLVYQAYLNDNSGEYGSELTSNSGQQGESSQPGASMVADPAAYKGLRGKKLGENQAVNELKMTSQGGILDPGRVGGDEGVKGEAGTIEGEGKVNTSINNKSPNKLAQDIYQKAEIAEPKVTETLKSLEVNGAHLKGLEFKLKSTDSLARKILTDSQLKGISLDESASGISDSLRYTLVINEANYAQTVESSLIKLQDQGYTINKVKNYWGNKTYQGINAILTAPEGLKIELQFHTDASYYTKEVLNHSYYEIERSLTASLDEAKEANKIMVENQSNVRIPNGAQNIWKSKGNK